MTTFTCHSFVHSKTPIHSLPGAVTTQWLDSDGVATVDNCQQHSDYSVDQLWICHAASTLTMVDYTITGPATV